MKSIRIVYNPVHDGETVSGSIQRQRKRGDSYINVDTISVVTGEPGSDRTFLLEDDERLIVEGSSTTRVVVDREQFAATPSIGRATVPATPVVSDGDESPEVSADQRAQRGAELQALKAEEERAKAITAAREKAQQMQKPAPAPLSQKSGEEIQKENQAKAQQADAEEARRGGDVVVERNIATQNEVRKEEGKEPLATARPNTGSQPPGSAVKK